MSEILDLLPVAGGSAGAGVGLALLGRAALEWVRGRAPGSVRPPRAPSPVPPPAQPQCSEDVERKVGEMHKHLLKSEDDGGIILLRAVRETAAHTSEMRQILGEIRDSLRPRAPMGSHPGAAE